MNSMTDNTDKMEFPAGLRVLAVDDDRVCLLILSKMLRQCRYRVTTCERAADALKLLRENKDGFDVVISDVHMPDMDGFKLLELVGLEMDLPVIMMSANGETRAVMKGIKHGACDYLLKPVRIEELKVIWQHVVRKRKDDSKQRADDSLKSSKKRKDAAQEDEDDAEVDNEDPSASKKPRVVWTVDLHQKFVGAVDQLGIDKAVPKRILELMDVQGLTRENVASHLQKYRLYLKRLSAPPHQPGSANYGSIDERYAGGLTDFRTCLPAQTLVSSLHRGPSNRTGQNNHLFGQIAALQGRLPYGLLDSRGLDGGGGFGLHDNSRQSRQIMGIGNNQIGFDQGHNSSVMQPPLPPPSGGILSMIGSSMPIQDATINVSNLEPCAGMNSKPYGSSDVGIYNNIPLASNVLPLSSSILQRNEIGQTHHLLYSNPVDSAASSNNILSSDNLSSRLNPGLGDGWQMDWHATGFNQPSGTILAPNLNSQYIRNPPLPLSMNQAPLKVGTDVDLKSHAFPVCSSISSEQCFGESDAKFKEAALLDAFLGSKGEHGVPEPFRMASPMDDLLASYIKEQHEDVMELMEGDFGN